jgi:D-ribulokinase
MERQFYLGIDFGTSGARSILIDECDRIWIQNKYPFDIANPDVSVWRTALFVLLEQTCQQMQSRRDFLSEFPRGTRLARIAINGTSATVLLCDATGTPLDTPILYNDRRGAAVLQQLQTLAPEQHPVLSATSSLAKLVWILNERKMGKWADKRDFYFLHQADWLTFLLHGKLGISDYHNALKLGCDVETLSYPQWLTSGLMALQTELDFPIHLPQIVAPGTPIGSVTSDVASRFGLSPDCLVCAGTTDSIAAFLASGVTSPGTAVTSLGSTLVLKLLSRTRIDDGRYGIYSHRLGDLWLTGGASNTGGAVLRQFFSNVELERLSLQIPDVESLLDYYPLTQPGERFPINDAQLPPRLEPKPDDSVAFLHGLLESMGRIEGRGYRLLQELGATPLTQVYTAGGGAKNLAWQRIRERHLQVPVRVSVQTEAAYGTALLAKNGLENG